MPTFLRWSQQRLWLIALFLALCLPDSLLQFHPAVLLTLPIELPLFGLALLAPGGAGRGLRLCAAAVLAGRVTLIFADTVSYQVFARPFNPVFDIYLLADAANLLNGVLGRVAALAIGGLVAALMAAIVFGAFFALQKMREPLLRRRGITLAVFLCILAVWAGLRAIESPRATQRLIDHFRLHAHNTGRSIVDMREFRAQLAGRPPAEPTGAALLEKLRGKDVLVIFIESYGRTLLDKAEFSGDFQQFLADRQSRLETSGVGVRSAFLTSPTVGGLSWLAHATAMSGLWIDNQVRYDSLVLSDHKSLNRLFREAGWRTVGVMPAITMVWPEGEYFGYDQLYHAHNSGYAGKPFNWITMPDQYTLAAFHRAELKPGERAPVMAEIALISSHAPSTPVPTLVDWQAVGDGQIFNPQASSGATPEEVWQDPARIRLQYYRAVLYSLDTLIDYVVTLGNPNLVVLAFGDHVPAPLVTGAGGNRDVPVHLFSRDPAILEAVAQWNWSASLLPATPGPVWPMSQLREKWVEAMSTSP